MRFYTTIFILFIYITTFAKGDIKTIQISDSLKELDLTEYTYLYSYKDSNTNILDAEFVYSAKGLKGINDNTIYWERFSFNNPTGIEKEYYIYFPYAVINELNVYIDENGSLVHLSSLGMKFNPNDKAIQSIGYPFLIKLKPGKTNVYINIKHYNLSLRTMSFLLSEKALIKSNTSSERIIWFWKGFFFFATLISIILYILTKLRMFIYYFLLNIGTGLLFSGELGAITDFVSKIPYNFTANIKQTGVLMAFIFLPLLINEITPIAKLRPRLWKTTFALNIIIGLTWLSCLVPASLNNKILLITTYVYNYAGPTILFLQLHLIFVAFKANKKNSLPLLIGYSVYSFALLLYIILPNLGIIKNSLQVYNMFIYGSIFEILMFMTLIGKETLSVYLERELLIKDQKNHQSDIIRAIVESQERERDNVGRELHDMIGANISVIKQQADKKNKLLINTIQSTFEMVRNLSHVLVTPLIKDNAFIDEIKDLCLLFSNDEIKINAHFHNWKNMEDTIMATHLYRIVQELLQNAVRHSSASYVIIQFIVNDDNELTLMYEDDGLGFNHDKVISNKGLGLINIENRIKIIGAEITFDSMEGQKGTTIIINLPLN
ncbi:MAG: hypothetical protein B6I18_03350 [Bacteroidetes bacterium 4572_112]|nr:MAG: hypothetical protein B6I18_03350 [Bacteroidetes bacterium 4572_112]